MKKFRQTQYRKLQETWSKNVSDLYNKGRATGNKQFTAEANKLKLYGQLRGYDNKRNINPRAAASVLQDIKSSALHMPTLNAEYDYINHRQQLASNKRTAAHYTYNWNSRTPEVKAARDRADNNYHKWSDKLVDVSKRISSTWKKDNE